MCGGGPVREDQGIGKGETMLTVAISNTQPIDATQNEFIVYGTITPTGSYPANGDTLNLSGFSQIPANALPLWIEVQEIAAAGATPTGYYFVFLPGTTLANGLLAIFTSAGTQFSTGAYGSGSPSLAGVVFRFRAWFQSFS
jgi:hypothetical protein